MNAAAPATSVPAPLWRRLAALGYDLVAVLALVLAIGLLCQLAAGGELIATQGGHLAAPWWYPALQLAAVATYFALSWTRGGQTLGMRPWRTRVTAAGDALGAGRALARFALAASPLLLLALGRALDARGVLVAMALAWALDFAVALIDRQRRALHDILAGTAVELRR
ncbi:MAG: RDD family protein [Mizugakiibacter sp.]|uniref:RDD family protein n=1 Tax=Mizugakiibacter sp. TaxID=1972610 RepID=UPI0031C6DD5F|nr:RDD family protein [Xanthomonadaceae bacterium]